MVTHTAMDHNQQFRKEDSITIELQTLRKIFEDRPLNSIITLSCKCSGCGNDLLIDITHTSGGFGFKGGFLVEYAPDKYVVKCHNCYDLDKKILKC
jgi:hypothetical protein